MKLIIAEKPSMGREIAAVLGATTPHHGYLSGGRYCVTWAVGHLIEAVKPEDFNLDWQHWRLEHLPIPLLPPEFRYRPAPKTLDQYRTIEQLLSRSDLISVVNACDAGREGELIFWLIYNQAQSRLPVERLWISSLTAESIRSGFQNLRSAEEFNGLRSAAYARAEADWQMGINATRAQTAVARRQGGRSVYSLGRVQTPTLSLVVRRDREIENFKPANYFELEAEFNLLETNESFRARAINPETGLFIRFDAAAAAVEQIRLLNGATPTLFRKVSRRNVSLNSPLLFDLTALQRTANTCFGISAAHTLEICQTLYERKFITYPRTASAYLTADVAAEASGNLEKLPSLYLPFVAVIRSENYHLAKRLINANKVTDHHAIIPTANSPRLETLSDQERSIYDLIARRFLAAFYPAAVDERVDAVVQHGTVLFGAKGVTEISAGWRVVEKIELAAENSDDGLIAEKDELAQKLPFLIETAALRCVNLKSLDKQTRAPARLTESALLQLMETCGKFVADEQFAAAMKDTGIGTPATRASVIEKLIKLNFIAREKKYLRSTAMGRELIKRVENVNCLLASPQLTGKWEQALIKIERGEMSAADFNQSVLELTRKTVEQICSQLNFELPAAAFSETNAAENNSFAAAEGAVSCPLCEKSARPPSFLRAVKQDNVHYAVCSAGREICGYSTDVPSKKKHAKALSGSQCPLCGGVMRFRLTKSGQPLLSCFAGNCKGVIWLENRQQKTKSQRS